MTRHRLLLFVFLSALAPLSLHRAGADEANLYPEQYFALPDGMRVRYVESGSGFPLVFVHGLLADNRQWIHNYPHFEGSYRVIGLDLPGHGGSDRIAGYDYSIASHTNALLALLDHLQIERAMLVGNSMGGHVSLYAAIHHPDRVAALVLVDPAGAELSTFERTVLAAGRVVNPFRLYPGRRTGRLLARFVITRNLSSPIVKAYTKEIEAVSRDPESRELAYEVMTKCLRSIENDHVTNELDQIEQPTLILWGTRDLLLAPRYGYEMHREIPNSELVMYQGLGHVPSVEAPTVFNERVDRFLEDLSSETISSTGSGALAKR